MSLMKRNKAGNFTRDCDQVSVETMISRHDYYEEVLKKCAESLELSSTESGDRVVTLLSSGGAVIPSSPEWTLVIICDSYIVDPATLVWELVM